MVGPWIAGAVVETKLYFIGGIGDTTVSNYSGAMFVVGGSGVTFALSAAQDLVLAGDGSRTKVIEIIWSVVDPGLSFLQPCVGFRGAEMLFQLSWSILSRCLFHSCLKTVPPEFASRCSTLVL